MEIISEWFSGWNITGTMWLWFIPAAAFTLFSAMKMVKYAELIIEKTRMGGAFVGLVLVSMITSIPEMITEISQGLANSPETGLSDDIGANAFSTFMLAIASLIFIKSMFVKNLGIWTKITIGISFVLSLIMTIILFYSADIQIGTSGRIAIGIVPLFMMLIYIIFVYFSYRYRHLADEEPKEVIQTTRSNKQIFLIFGLFSFMLISASLFLNWVTDSMQITYSIDPKSAGGILLSMTTAMPEVVALFSLARKGYLTAATGSIIGSHIFNFSAILWGDLAYTGSDIIHGPGVNSIWMIGLMLTVEVGLLLVFSIVGKRIKSKILYATFPSLIIITYIIGWSMILFL
ncbi:MAG: hypothetical protein HRT99_01520 [Mycoplasmatales bacterium]|nr:hypothetical protein [Mycoplasmatales bacterium]